MKKVSLILAIGYLEKNLALSEELNYRKGIAKAVNALADISMVKKDYSKAISYYNRAIEVSRLINNKLVLGESLVEKGEALIESNRIEEAQQFQREAIVMVEDLGNPDLIFKTKIFSAKLAFAMKEKEKAQQILHKLAKEYTSDFEQGNIYFWLYKITQQDIYKNKSLAKYQKLYVETPLYLFEERIKELS